LSSWYPSGPGASKREKSSIKSTSKTGIESDRASLGFAIGHAYDREVLRANFKANAKFWNAVALIGPNDPPINILGGYKFPLSPELQKRLAELCECWDAGGDGIPQRWLWRRGQS
jgi:hypothetical protein